MRRIYHHRVDLRQLQNVEDRLPVHPGALHRHVPAVGLRQPKHHLPQLVGGRPKRPDLSAPRLQQTRDDRILVNVQPTAAIVNYFHPLIASNEESIGEAALVARVYLSCSLSNSEDNNLWFL